MQRLYFGRERNGRLRRPDIHTDYLAAKTHTVIADGIAVGVDDRLAGEVAYARIAAVVIGSGSGGSGTQRQASGNSANASATEMIVPRRCGGGRAGDAHAEGGQVQPQWFCEN